MPGARRTRSLAWKNKNHTSVVTTGSSESPDIPARNGLTAYDALSPEYRAFLPPSPREYGRQRPVGMTGLRKT